MSNAIGTTLQRPLPLFVILAGLVVGSCGSEGTDAGSGGTATSAQSEAVAEYPFVQAFGWLARDRPGDAGDPLATCLASAGYGPEALPDDATDSPLEVPNSSYAALMVVPSVESAREGGYGIVDGIVAAESTVEDEPSPFEQFLADLTEEGASQFGAVLEECFDSVRGPEMVEQAAIESMMADYQTSPLLAEIHASWSSCMAEAGFVGFADPTAARISVSKLYFEPLGDAAMVPTDVLTAEHKRSTRDYEIRVATADATCQQRTVVTRRQDLVQLQEKILEDAGFGLR
jgi:hypothetical protein